MWASEAAKLPVLEFSLDKILAGLDLTYDQFVDVCILAGCDYCETIRGIAATTAYKQVRAQAAILPLLFCLSIFLVLLLRSHHFISSLNALPSKL